MLIQRYKEMVEELYREPNEEVIIGSFTEKNTSAVDINIRVPQAKKEKKDKTSLVKKPKECQDIHKFFWKY